MDIDKEVQREELSNSAQVQEIVSFIEHQINNPFESDVNFIKNLRDLFDSKKDPELNQLSIDILNGIMNHYGMKMDAGEMESIEDSAYETTKCMYKFFVKNARKITYIFLREYLSSNKVRKNLVSCYDVKNPFPKETYGKKENFILITKLKDIVKDVQDSDLSLKDMLNYITKTEDQGYIDMILELDSNFSLRSEGIVKKMIKEFRKSDIYSKMINQLTIDMFSIVINPSLKSIGVDPKETLIFQKDIQESLPDEEDDYQNEGQYN